MIFLDYLYNLPNATEGIDSIATQTITELPLLTPFLLMFIFLVVFLGGSTRQKLRTGTADYAAWAIVGSIAILLPALLLSVSSGFIRLDWLIIVVTLNIGSAVWFFLDRKVTEV